MADILRDKKPLNCVSRNMTQNITEIFPVNSEFILFVLQIIFHVREKIWSYIPTGGWGV